MLIIGSATLNLSTCCGKATCATQRDEWRGARPGSEADEHPSPPASRGRSPQWGCKGLQSRKDTEERDSRTKHALHWTHANCRTGPSTATTPPPRAGQIPPFPSLLHRYVRDRSLRLLLQGPNHTCRKFAWGLCLSRVISKLFAGITPESS